MRPLPHRFFYSAVVLLSIYVLHFFLLDHFLTPSADAHLRVGTYSSALIHHPHPKRHSGLVLLRMLEKHEGAKQPVAPPIADIPVLLSRIVLLVTEQPDTRVVCYRDIYHLSPVSYRLYLQDRVFRI